MFQHVMVPETQDRIALDAHEIIALAVVGTVGVLGSIDFNDKPFFSAGEVCKKGADGELAGESIAAKFARL